MNKQNKTYPVTYDAIVGTGGPGKLTKPQGENLEDFHRAATHDHLQRIAQGEPPGQPAIEALHSMGVMNPKGYAQDLSATNSLTIPETKRRMLGLLPPKIPFNHQVRVGLRDLAGFAQKDPDKADLDGTVASLPNKSGPMDIDKVLTAFRLASNHYRTNLKDIAHNHLPVTMAARRKSPEEYMDRMNQTPEEFMPGLKKTSDVSFEWAKNASWDQYEEELERALSLRKTAAGMPSVLGSSGGGDFPTTPPPAAGFMDTAKDYGNKAMGAISEGWGKLPTWGQGALIGGGIGALGGLMTDKKKTRGLLQGALMGGGLGALGGYAYSQMPGRQTPAIDPSKNFKPPVAPVPGTAAPGDSETGWFSGLKNDIGNAYDHVKDVTGKGLNAGTALAGTGVGAGVGMYAGGHYLNRSGQKNTQVVGAPESLTSNAGKDAPVVRVAPGAAAGMNRLARDPAQQNAVLSNLAMQPSPGAPRNNQSNVTPDGQQQAANSRALLQDGDYNLGKRVYDKTIGRIAPHQLEFQAGDHTVKATRPQLLQEQARLLAANANQASLRPQNAVERGLLGRRIAGNTLKGIGGLTALGSTAGGIASLIPNKPPIVSNMGQLNDSQDSWNKLLGSVYGKADAAQQAKAYADAMGWGEQARQYINNALTGKQ